MKVSDVILAEGMIEVPDEMVERASHIFAIVMFSTLRSILLTKAVGIPAAPKLFDRWLADRFPDVKLRPYDVRKTKVTANLDATPIARGRYELHIPEDRELRPIKLEFVGTDKIGGSGEYDSDTQTVVIAVPVSWNPQKFVDACQYLTKSRDNREQAHQYAIELLDRLSDTYHRQVGTVKHELTHAVQFMVLQHTHPDQVDGNQVAVPDGTEHGDARYYNTQTEFDPQIKTAIADTIVLYNKLKRNGENVTIRDLVDYQIGNADSLASKLQKPTLVDRRPNPLFAALKARPARWKKAVRVFLTGLQQELSRK